MVQPSRLSEPRSTAGIRSCRHVNWRKWISVLICGTGFLYHVAFDDGEDAFARSQGLSIFALLIAYQLTLGKSEDSWSIRPGLL